MAWKEGVETGNPYDRPLSQYRHWTVVVTFKYIRGVQAIFVAPGSQLSKRLFMGKTVESVHLRAWFR